MQKDEEAPSLRSYTIEIILKQKLPNPPEQANNFILWLGEVVPGVGETQFVTPEIDMSTIGAKTEQGFALIIQQLMESGLIIGDKSTASGHGTYTLSFEGCEYYDRLKRGAVNSNKAFMAMKFDDAELDEMLESCFKPAVLATGFDLVTLQDNPRAGLIDDRLRVEIRAARFLIADLTHENAGSYWEAGFAEGLGKPVIYICEKKKSGEEKTHFDTNHHLPVVWDSANPTQAIEDLKNTIRATLPAEAKLSDV